MYVCVYINNVYIYIYIYIYIERERERERERDDVVSESCALFLNPKHSGIERPGGASPRSFITPMEATVGPATAAATNSYYY